MELEDQVAPFDLAMKMREAGFPQDCHFSWIGDEKDHWVGGPEDPAWGPDGSEVGRVAAPTVAEMGEWLPYEVLGREPAQYELEVHKGKSGWRMEYSYWNGEFLDGEYGLAAVTEAEARARLLLALISAGALPLGSIR